MKYLILTISGNEENKNNVQVNELLLYELPKKMLGKYKLPDNVDYMIYTNYHTDFSEYASFKYFNEMFYKLADKIRAYDYLILLDDDDSFLMDKVNAIINTTQNKEYNYMHNTPIYLDSGAYKYNNINHNNSCITVKTDKIDFELFRDTKSLSDFLLWLPINSGILQLNKVFTFIRLKYLTDYEKFHDYMLNRYTLRFEDLQSLLKKYEHPHNKNDKVMFYRILWEFNKYDNILHGHRHISDPFTFLHSKKGVDWFIEREYNIMGGLK